MIALIILFVALIFAPAGAWAQQAAGQLKIVDVLFEDYKGDLDSRREMRAGEEVSLTFRVEGFRRQEVETREGMRQERVNLHYQLELRDPLGVLVTPEEEGDVDTTLGPRDNEWRPKVRWSASVPASAPSGDYKILIRVSDRQAHQDSARNVSFRVRGQSVPPSDHLEVVQLEYAAAEGGPWNPERYFSPAEPIWVRYKIAGYGVSPEKEVAVEQDWTVLDDGGKVIAFEANAAVEKQQSFYPPRFLSTIFDLNLERPKPGKYTLRIDLRDRIRDQSASLESNFFLRP